MAHHRTTRAEVDLLAFRQNFQSLRSCLDQQTKVMAVIKADGYGHGAVPCAKIAVECGADYLGAGVIEEGIELRENGLNTPTLVLGSIFPDEA
ncbi:MAG: alanine racemase, partial [Nitrospinae bacterium]|nr:alanine racemase [Nitrospinota bacterium]